MSGLGTLETVLKGDLWLVVLRLCFLRLRSCCLGCSVSLRLLLLGILRRGAWLVGAWLVAAGFFLGLVFAAVSCCIFLLFLPLFCLWCFASFVGCF
jgi:hypothetical protein